MRCEREGPGPDLVDHTSVGIDRVGPDDHSVHGTHPVRALRVRYEAGSDPALPQVPGEQTPFAPGSALENDHLARPSGSGKSHERSVDRGATAEREDPTPRGKSPPNDSEESGDLPVELRPPIVHPPPEVTSKEGEGLVVAEPSPVDGPPAEDAHRGLRGFEEPCDPPDVVAKLPQGQGAPEIGDAGDGPQSSVGQALCAGTSILSHLAKRAHEDDLVRGTNLAAGRAGHAGGTDRPVIYSLGVHARTGRALCRSAYRRSFEARRSSRPA